MCVEGTTVNRFRSSAIPAKGPVPGGCSILRLVFPLRPYALDTTFTGGHTMQGGGGWGSTPLGNGRQPNKPMWITFCYQKHISVSLTRNLYYPTVFVTSQKFYPCGTFGGNKNENRGSRDSVPWVETGRRFGLPSERKAPTHPIGWPAPGMVLAPLHPQISLFLAVAPIPLPGLPQPTLTVCSAPPGGSELFPRPMLPHTLFPG